MLDFIGVGVSKCATSWIAETLNQHPQIYIPKIKELHYFNKRSDNYSNCNYYLKQIFEGKENFIKGEFTPRYSIDKNALLRIKKICPDTKIILCLRDPIERAFSQYSYFVLNKRKENSLDFIQSICGFYKEDYLTKSLYYKQVYNIFSIFNPNNVKVLFYQDLISDPKKFIQSLLNFLNLTMINNVNSSTPCNVTRINGNFSYMENYLNKYISNIKYSENFKDDHLMRVLIKLRFPYNFSNKIIKNKFLIKLIKMTRTKKINLNLSYNNRRYLFNKYFLEDIEKLELILNKDLSIWKY